MRKPHPFEALTISALEKVLPGQPRPGRRYDRATMLKNERFHFQVALKVAMDDKAMVVPQVSSAIGDAISLYAVGMVPAELLHEPCCDPMDTNFLTDVPGLIPDVLMPLPQAGLSLVPRQWRCLWVTVAPKAGEALMPGVYPIDIDFMAGDSTATRVRFELTVLDAELPPQSLTYTTWFHLDSLMQHYQVEAFDERHWALIENYLASAAEYGVNMVLTPCFTPPLDTEVGGERPTVQLVDVTVKDDGTYAFGFEKLGRYIALCQRCGIDRFEIAHLFTQWGAAAAPKIMAQVEGKEKRIFGWDTPTGDAGYTAFLQAYLPELTAYLASLGALERCYFHISDEPTLKHLDNYRKASDILRPLLEGVPIMDALSDYELYEKGLVKLPVCSTHSLETFAERGVKPLWTYYCAFGTDFLTMRALAAPSARNRIFGHQLYRYDVDGFLHWGYNFYSTRFSLYPVDPYRYTDGSAFCAAGDCFMVYPGADGHPVSSIHQEVFFDALQDLRALRALEAKLGRDAVLKMVDEALYPGLTMFEYPKDDEWLLAMRDRINRLLAEG